MGLPPHANCLPLFHHTPALPHSPSHSRTPTKTLLLDERINQGAPALFLRGSLCECGHFTRASFVSS